MSSCVSTTRSAPYVQEISLYPRRRAHTVEDPAVLFVSILLNNPVSGNGPCPPLYRHCGGRRVEVLGCRCLPVFLLQTKHTEHAESLGRNQDD